MRERGLGADRARSVLEQLTPEAWYDLSRYVADSRAAAARRSRLPGGAAEDRKG